MHAIFMRLILRECELVHIIQMDEIGPLLLDIWSNPDLFCVSAAGLLNRTMPWCTVGSWRQVLN